jgi:tRNA 2-selenouridine synthase
MFDSLVWAQLRQLLPHKPVYIEAESKKVGMVRVPEQLIASMWQSAQCLRLSTADDLRIDLLKADYAYYLNNPHILKHKLSYLTVRHGHTQIQQWQDWIDQAQWDTLISDLLTRHYDPHYTKSITQHYPGYEQASHLIVDNIHEDNWLTLAQHLIANQQP